MVNVYHVTIQTFGTMIEKNVRHVLQLMFLTSKEENVFVQLINPSILALPVSSAYNQVTGNPIREDASNVQINKFMIA